MLFCIKILETQLTVFVRSFWPAHCSQLSHRPVYITDINPSKASLEVDTRKQVTGRFNLDVGCLVDSLLSYGWQRNGSRSADTNGTGLC